MGVFVIEIETRRWFRRTRRVAVAAQAPDLVLERMRRLVPGRHRLAGAIWHETSAPAVARTIVAPAGEDRFMVHRVLDARVRAAGFDYATGLFRPGQRSAAALAIARAIARAAGPMPRDEAAFLRLTGPFGQGYATALARSALKRSGAPPEYAREVHRALCLVWFGAALKDETAATAAALAVGDPAFAEGARAAQDALRAARCRPLHAAALRPLARFVATGQKPPRRWL